MFSNDAVARGATATPGWTDDDTHAKQMPGVGDRLAVIAGAGGNEAGSSLSIACSADEIHTPAHLECADRLQIFALGVVIETEHLRQLWHGHQWRLGQIRTD